MSEIILEPYKDPQAKEQGARDNFVGVWGDNR